MKKFKIWAAKVLRDSTSEWCLWIDWVMMYINSRADYTVCGFMRLHWTPAKCLWTSQMSNANMLSEYVHMFKGGVYCMRLYACIFNKHMHSASILLEWGEHANKLSEYVHTFTYTYIHYWVKIYIYSTVDYMKVYLLLSEYVYTLHFRIWLSE